MATGNFPGAINTKSRKSQKNTSKSQEQAQVNSTMCSVCEQTILDGKPGQESIFFVKVSVLAGYIEDVLHSLKEHSSWLEIGLEFRKLHSARPIFHIL